MSEMVYKNYLFSSREYLVLSACAGMEEVPILHTEQTEWMDREEINRTVFDLYRKGILCWEQEGKCELKPEVHRMFQCIKNAGTGLQIVSGDGSNLLCCLGEQEVVVTERSDTDRDRIRMHRLSVRELLMELCDRRILPQRDSQAEEEMDQDPYLRHFLQNAIMLEKEDPICQERMQELLRMYPEVSAYMLVWDRAEKREKAVIFLLECGLYDACVCTGRENVQLCCYTMENLLRMLAEMGGAGK